MKSPFEDDNLLAYIVQFAPYDAFARAPNQAWRAVARGVIAQERPWRISADIMHNFPGSGCLPCKGQDHCFYPRDHPDCRACDWTVLSRNIRSVPVEFVREFAPWINWHVVVNPEQGTSNPPNYRTDLLDLIHEFRHLVNWEGVDYSCVPIELIRQNMDDVDWPSVSNSPGLSEDQIRKWADYVDWIEISGYQVLSEAFIEEFADRVQWGDIGSCQDLSEDFMRKWADRIV